MFKHLLLPLDFEDLAEEVLATVRDLALHSTARITLIHVIEEIRDVEGPEISAFYERLERRAHEKLEAVSSELRGADVECDLVVCRGRRSEEIVRYAAESSIDLIALRSRNLQQTAGRWPTISMQVAMLSPVPVLLLR